MIGNAGRRLSRASREARTQVLVRDRVIRLVEGEARQPRLRILRGPLGAGKPRRAARSAAGVAGSPAHGGRETHPRGTPKRANHPGSGGRAVHLTGHREIPTEEHLPEVPERRSRRHPLPCRTRWSPQAMTCLPSSPDQKQPSHGVEYPACRPASLRQSLTIGTPPISIKRTLPAEPKSIVTVAVGPAPFVSSTLPSPYLS